MLKPVVHWLGVDTQWFMGGLRSEQTLKLGAKPPSKLHHNRHNTYEPDKRRLLHFQGGQGKTGC
jgi:hypothetical protein